MNRLFLLISLLSAVLNLDAQVLTVSFQAKNAEERIDSIRVTNLATNQEVLLQEGESLLLEPNTGSVLPGNSPMEGTLFPNPAQGQATLRFSTGSPQQVTVSVVGTSGQQLFGERLRLAPGLHSWHLRFPAGGLYLVSVVTGDERYGFKVVSSGGPAQDGRLDFLGTAHPLNDRGTDYRGIRTLLHDSRTNSQTDGLTDSRISGSRLENLIAEKPTGASATLKHATDQKRIPFTPGDMLLYSVFSGQNTTIITDSPTESKTYAVEFVSCTDPAGKHYPVVKIRNRWGMASNLAWLPAVHPASSGSGTEKRYYVYDDEGTEVVAARSSALYEAFGVLYNWPAALGDSKPGVGDTAIVRGICPEGWHIPNQSEWGRLGEALGGKALAGGRMKALNAWGFPNTGATNASGFSALPGGKRDQAGFFDGIGLEGGWWSATEASPSEAGIIRLTYDDGSLEQRSVPKQSGYSLRCIKDTTVVDPGTGNVIINGPGGSNCVLPEEFRNWNVTMTLPEFPATELLLEGQQAASAGMRIDLAGAPAVGSSGNYEINIPVTLAQPEANRLRLNLRGEDGVILQLPGDYNPVTKIFTVKTFGFVHDWAMVVASGSEIITVNTDGGTKSSLIGEQVITFTWNNNHYAIYDVSQQPERFTAEMITTHMVPLARDVLVTLEAHGYEAPNLVTDEEGRYKLILDNQEHSAYSPPWEGVLGRVTVGYQDFVSDLNTPANWSNQLKKVLMHETFHAVQYAYGTVPGLPRSFLVGTHLRNYKEGTATPVGETYGVRNTLSPGDVYVRENSESDGPHDPGFAVDDPEKGSPYDRQDFFVFASKRYSGGNLIYPDSLFRNIRSAVQAEITSLDDKNKVLLAMRKGMNNFFIEKKLTLPEAYTEYALQRLYLHQADYLLRGGESPASDVRFSPDRLASHLLEESGKYKLWTPEAGNLLKYAPLKMEGIRPLSSAAATLALPEDLIPSGLPDSLAFTFTLTGNAKISADVKAEGFRIRIIRAKDVHGTKVAKDPVVNVTDADRPVKVSLKDGVTHLVLLMVNAYVEDVTTDLEVVAEEVPTGKFTDPRDGNVYGVVQIGDQFWLKENLKYLPKVDSTHHWSFTEPKYYVYGYNGDDAGAAKGTANYQNYGVLYNWPAAAAACPPGWHLFSKTEWDTLLNALGGWWTGIVGGKLKSTRTDPVAHPRWESPNTGANNISGWSGLPGGSHYPHDWDFLTEGMGFEGHWWTSTPSVENRAVSYDLYHDSANYGIPYNGKWKHEGLSVRCVKDTP